jgi:hypothetical protein
MSSSAYVFEGPWINHSHNIFIGATITLKDRDAAFLLALLALVVAAAGRSFWTIFSYIAHQSRCTDSPQDAQFYQQQAILKNSASSLGAAWKFARISFSWRKHERSRGSSTIIFIPIALFLAIAFGVASIFSSQVTKDAGLEVLINSPNCS